MSNPVSIELSERTHDQHGINVASQDETTAVEDAWYPDSSSEDEISNPTAEQFFQTPGFYANAKKYWESVAPTVDGMLGGLSMVDRTDIHSSSEFLKQLLKMKPAVGNERALDCGAGIGRVTKNLLVKFFRTVDLVEQDKAFVAKAHEYLTVNGAQHPNVGEIFNEGLQIFTPKLAHYDVIWSQWVLGHLTDADLQAFFERCALALKPNGCLVIKENFTATDDFSIDPNDSSVTRSLRITKDILTAAGFRPINTVKQKNFIEGLFPVYTLACKTFSKVKHCSEC